MDQSIILQFVFLFSYISFVIVICNCYCYYQNKCFYLSIYLSIDLTIYLKNKKPTFLACIHEQVSAAILESSKNNDFLQKRQTYFHRILEYSLFLILEYFLSLFNWLKEAKTSKEGSFLPQRATICKEIGSNSNKEHIK